MMFMVIIVIFSIYYQTDMVWGVHPAPTPFPLLIHACYQGRLALKFSLELSTISLFLSLLPYRIVMTENRLLGLVETEF